MKKNIFSIKNKIRFYCCLNYHKIHLFGIKLAEKEFFQPKSWCWVLPQYINKRNKTLRIKSICLIMILMHQFCSIVNLPTAIELRRLTRS